MAPRDVLRVLGSLRDAGIMAYVGGGWGIDALVAEQTRPHQDLDLSFDATRVAAVIETLTRAGFELAEDQRPVRFVMRDQAGCTVDLHPVTFDASGAGVQAGFAGDLQYPSGAFTTGKIDGQPVACFSAALQVRFHSGYAPGPKDLHDLGLLRRLQSEGAIRSM